MAGKRKALGKKTRFEVFKRDEFTCQYCGRTPPQAILQCDHIVPVASGGSNHEGNLVTSCRDCNLGKGANSLASAPRAIGDQIAERKERSEQVASYNEFLVSERERTDAAIQRIGQYWYEQFVENSTYVFGSARATSIRVFLQQLPEAEILDSVDVAMSRFFPSGMNDDRTFKYFCGVCWRKVRERE